MIQFRIGPAVDRRGSGRWRGQADQRPQRGGLPGTVRAQEAGDLPWFEADGEVVNRGDRSVAFGEVVEADPGHRWRSLVAVGEVVTVDGRIEGPCSASSCSRHLRLLPEQ